MQQSQQTTSRPFPLKSLLIIYIKANRQLYINYFAGFKALVNFLGPIEIPETDFKYKQHLGSYEIQEIANILKCPQAVIQKTFLEIEVNTHAICKC